MRSDENREPDDPPKPLPTEAQDKKLRKRFTRWDWRANWPTYSASTVCFVLAAYCVFIRDALDYGIGFAILGVGCALWRTARELWAKTPWGGFGGKRGKDVAKDRVTTPTTARLPGSDSPGEQAASAEPCRSSSPEPPHEE